MIKHTLAEKIKTHKYKTCFKVDNSRPDSQSPHQETLVVGGEVAKMSLGPMIYRQYSKELDKNRKKEWRQTLAMRIRPEKKEIIQRIYNLTAVNVVKDLLQRTSLTRI